MAKTVRKQDTCLYDLERFLFGDFETGVLTYGDGLFETERGCFRLAYSEKQRTFFLFFGLHREELQVTRDEKGRLAFTYPERLFLIRGFQALASDWVGKDGRLRLDATWVPHEMSAFTDRLERALFHEGALHQVMPGASASAHLSYALEALPKGLLDQAKIQIQTRAHSRHLLADTPLRLYGGAEAGKTVSLLRRFRDKIGKRWAHLTQPTAYLSMKEKILNDGETVISAFDSEGIGSLIALDHWLRLEHIRHGFAPVQCSESPRLWITHTGNTVCDRVVSFIQDFRHNPDNASRDAFKIIAHSILRSLQSSSVAALLDSFVECAGEVGRRENLDVLKTGARRHWIRLIAHHEKRRLPVLPIYRSELHELLVNVNPNKMEDITPCDPQRHAALTGLEKAKAPDTFDLGRSDSLWLVRLLCMPYGSTLRYIDAKGGIFDPRFRTPAQIARHVRVVRVKTLEGIVLHYLPHEKKLFAHYHKPTYKGPGHLPSNAGSLFHENEMCVLDIKDLGAVINGTARLQTVPFEEGAAQIRAATFRAAQPLRIAPAAAPAANVCNGAAPKPPPATKPHAPKPSASAESFWTCEMP